MEWDASITQLFRHSLATLAYRAGKPLRNAPEGFSTFKAAPTTRAAGEILAHLGDLMAWSLSMADGDNQYKVSKPAAFDADVARFYDLLTKLDERVAGSQPVKAPPDRLLQGPIADALTHVGQLATLRRLAQSPVRGENYYGAAVTIGRVGLDQPAPTYEFD